MSPVTHFLVGWMVANVPASSGPRAIGRRERAAIALAGVAPDLDGLGAIPEVLTKHSAHPLLWFTDYHHVLGHNLAFALVVGLLGLFVLRSSAKTSHIFSIASAFHW